MVAMMLTGFLTLFGWALLMVMVFLNVVFGGAYDSREKDRKAATGAAS